MMNYEWPGNVRELENLMRRTMALGKTETLLPEFLPPNICTLPGGGLQDIGLLSKDSLSAYETAAIRNALAKTGNNRKKAARILGIGEATLYRKIKKYSLK